MVILGGRVTGAVDAWLLRDDGVLVEASWEDRLEASRGFAALVEEGRAAEARSSRALEADARGAHPPTIDSPAVGPKRGANHDGAGGTTPIGADPGAAAVGAGVALVASSADGGLSVRGKALRVAIAARVLPALDRHFAAMPEGSEDTAAWLVTRIVAATIARGISVDFASALARTIEASLGRGDETSTDQNLTAFGSLAHYQPKLVASPALVAARILGDLRLWPADPSALPALVAPAHALHRRALVQLVARQRRHHVSSPTIAAALDAIVGT